jgi:hypothetical protein
MIFILKGNKNVSIIFKAENWFEFWVKLLWVFQSSVGASEIERKQLATMFQIKVIGFLLILAPAALQTATDCSKLRYGQFLCPDPDSSYKYIDEKTQSVAGCTSDGKAMGKLINCFE